MKELIILLNVLDLDIQDEDIRIAKGYYKYPTTIKELKHKMNILWRLKRK